MRLLLRALVLALCFMTAYVSANTWIANPNRRKGAGPLFRIVRDGKVGYMNRAGRTQIAPRFEGAHDFMGGLAAVSIGEKWGYIRENGSIAIALQFEEAGDFVEELALVRVGRKWGYIDKSGRIAIPPGFQAAGEFHEGRARVYLWEKAFCESGREYTKDDGPLYLFVLPGGPGLETCFAKDGHFGFIDKTGAVVIPARFVWAEDMAEGLAAVRVEAGPGEEFGKIGYVDRNGTFVISPRFKVAASFSEGLAGVEVSSRREGDRLVDIQRGYINKAGEIVIPAAYDFVGTFSEGLARVGRGPGKMGYIDRSGRIVIPPRFSTAWDFSEGIAIACDDGGCNYINRNGTVALRNLKRALWPFSDGLTIVPADGERQVYIDNSGRVVANYN